jgi:hypothetical protein
LDETLHFFKKCKRTSVNHIYFSDIKESIEKSYGRRLTLEIFKQIVTLVPDFYEHGWERSSSSRGYQLIIEFGKQATGEKSFGLL